MGHKETIKAITQQLKLQHGMTGQVIININEAKVVLEDCKIYADSTTDGQIIFQARDPDNERRTVQFILTKSAKEISNKG